MKFQTTEFETRTNLVLICSKADFDCLPRQNSARQNFRTICASRLSVNSPEMKKGHPQTLLPSTISRKCVLTYRVLEISPL